MIRSCFRCGRDFSSETARACDSCKALAAASYSPSMSITRRDLSIAALVHGQLASKEIAFRLHLSERTVKQYVYLLIHKLGVQTRVGIALWYEREHAHKVAA